jgi:hypothetical protein
MLNHPEATNQALGLLRNGEPFQWHVITLLALVMYVYLNEISKKNWRGVAAGLALYMVHWSFEILNALIQHFSGHALWTVPTGSAFLLLVGVGVELSLMFSIAGLVLTKILPSDPKTKFFGVNNRVVFTVVNAGFFAFVEIFLARTPAFVWVYPWWGSFPVFVTVYIPFFAAAALAYDWPTQTQIRFIGALFVFNVLMMTVFGGLLKWI